MTEPCQTDEEKTADLLMKMNQQIAIQDIDAAFKYAEEMPDEVKETMGMPTVFQHSVILKRCDIAKKSYSQMAEILRGVYKLSLTQNCS